MPFTETDRYEPYAGELERESLVIDIGAHKGTFAHHINRIYGCRVLAFEPIREFADEARLLFNGNRAIELFEVAVGGHTGFSRFRVQGDATGEFLPINPIGDEEAVKVIMVSMVDILKTTPRAKLQVDLVKLNCEGGEFAILESLIRNNMLTMVRNWQIQFHKVVPDADWRRARIIADLMKDYEVTLDYPWVWESFRLKQ